MMDNTAFEALVFERAEEIRRHDKKIRLICMSAVPAAAAVMVLTAVGLDLLPVRSVFENTTQSDSTFYNADTAAADFSNAAEAPADTAALNEEYAAGDSAEEFSGMVPKGDIAEDAENGADVVFTPYRAEFSEDFSVKESVTITDPAVISRLMSLTELPAVETELSSDDVNEYTIKGELIFSDRNYDNTITMTITDKNIIQFSNGRSVEKLELDDASKKMLTEIFDIAFTE